MTPPNLSYTVRPYTGTLLKYLPEQNDPPPKTTLETIRHNVGAAIVQFGLQERIERKLCQIIVGHGKDTRLLNKV
jgi:hypothetical protein